MRMPAVRMPAGFKASPGGLAAAPGGVAVGFGAVPLVGPAAVVLSAAVADPMTVAAVATVADPIVVANRKWRRSKQFSPAVVLFPPL
jgi:hypothetical protein